MESRSLCRNVSDMQRYVVWSVISNTSRYRTMWYQVGIFHPGLIAEQFSRSRNKRGSMSIAPFILMLSSILSSRSALVASCAPYYLQADAYTLPSMPGTSRPGEFDSKDIPPTSAARGMLVCCVLLTPWFIPSSSGLSLQTRTDSAAP